MLRRTALALLAAAGLAAAASPLAADDAANIAADARTALQRLAEADPVAAELLDAADATLVFPRIVKAGLLVGGAYGEGALLSGDEVTGYYRSVAASYGLQAGAQTYGYALFFMNDAALDYLDRSEGWEIGSGPSVVVMDEGLAKRFSSTTLTQDVVAFIFSQSGLMAGLGIEGSKITRFDP